MLRELYEEIGLPPEHVQIIGRTRNHCATMSRTAGYDGIFAIITEAKSRFGFYCVWSDATTM